MSVQFKETEKEAAVPVLSLKQKFLHEFSNTYCIKTKVTWMLSQMTIGSKLRIIFDRFFMCQHSLSRLFSLVCQVCYTMASPFSHFKEEQHSKCIQIFNDDSKVMKLWESSWWYPKLLILVACVFLLSYISFCTSFLTFILFSLRSTATFSNGWWVTSAPWRWSQ